MLVSKVIAFVILFFCSGFLILEFAASYHYNVFALVINLLLLRFINSYYMDRSSIKNIYNISGAKSAMWLVTARAL